MTGVADIQIITTAHQKGHFCPIGEKHAGGCSTRFLIAVNIQTFRRLCRRHDLAVTKDVAVQGPDATSLLLMQLNEAGNRCVDHNKQDNQRRPQAAFRFS